MKKTKAAVIGAGPWGQNHIRAYSQLENAELAVVSDINEKALESVRSAYGCRTTARYQDIFSDKDIEAVSICTPASLHYRTARECLEAGKNVLVEKPLAMTSQEAKELVELARKKKLVLMTGHVYRFDPALALVRQKIKEREFGRVYYIYCELAGLKKPRADCGVIFNYGVHELDIMSYLLDEFPTDVCASTLHAFGGGHEDFAFLSAGFGSRCTGYSQVSWLPPGKWRDVWVIGEKKSAFIDTQKSEVKIYNSRIERKDGGFELLESDSETLVVEKKEPLKEEIRHFIEHIGTDRKPEADGEVGYKIVAALEACLESAKSGRKSVIRYG
jgi:predicted dehydrogenase